MKYSQLHHLKRMSVVCVCGRAVYKPTKCEPVCMCVYLGMRVCVSVCVFEYVDSSCVFSITK